MDSHELDAKMTIGENIKIVFLGFLIGTNYTISSFGCSKYCPRENPKQLVSSFSKLAKNLMRAIFNSKKPQRDFFVDCKLTINPKIAGIRQLAMELTAESFDQLTTEWIIKCIRAKVAGLMDVRVLAFTREQFCGY